LAFLNPSAGCARGAGRSGRGAHYGFGSLGPSSVGVHTKALRSSSGK